MEIKRSGSQPSRTASAEYFTGAVRIDPLFQAPDPAREQRQRHLRTGGASTNWHTAFLGQTLIITFGLRLDSATPGEKHRHGATPATAMTHIAIQEALNGNVADWLEKISANDTASEFTPRDGAEGARRRGPKLMRQHPSTSWRKRSPH